MLHQLLLQLAVTAASASDLQAELLRLEGLQRAKTIGGGDQLRLAELYFLTSRCEDVRKILKPLSKGPKGEATGAAGDLVCACGGPCAGRGELARLMAFRKLLDRGGRWKDKSVQAAWQKVSHLPEAKYWALKSLRADPMSFRDVTLHAARLELEQALDSLEVSR